MKQHLLVVITLIIISISSCKKDDSTNPANQPDCEKNNYGYLTVSNTADDPYDIYVNGAYKGPVQAHSIKQNIVVYQANGVFLRAEQTTGYVFYPTVRTSTVNIIECSTYSWQIP